MIRSLALFSKRITIPRLSPTHTQSKITRFLVKEGDEVEPYDTVFVVECSADFLTPGYREAADQNMSMIVENQEDGIVSNLDTEVLGKWLKVNTQVGVVDDGEEMDGDWTWQAYLHNNDNDSEKSS